VDNFFINIIIINIDVIAKWFNMTTGHIKDKISILSIDYNGTKT
jgi:hypothetical protein